MRSLPARVAALGVVCAFGCSTTYQPRSEPRIGLVIRRGGAFYVKDGNLTQIGPFGGDLESLVAASPDATRLAHRARRQLQFGVPLYVVGLGGVVASLAAASGAARWPLIGGSAVVAGTGLSLMGAGFTNAVDAVNVHNDFVDRR